MGWREEGDEGWRETEERIEEGGRKDETDGEEGSVRRVEIKLRKER